MIVSTGQQDESVIYIYISPPFQTLFPFRSGQFSSVAQSCPTLCDPMDCSMTGLPVHHQLPEFTQTHVHWVDDAIQPFHPLSSPSPPALNLSSIRVFSNELVLWIRGPKYWSLSFNISSSNEYSGLVYFRMDWLDLLAVHVAYKRPYSLLGTWLLQCFEKSLKPEVSLVLGIL